MNEKVFHGQPDRLRDPKRVEMLDLPSVVSASVEGLVPDSLLDVGTGTGLFAEAFVKSIPTIAGIDISEAMITEAKRLVPTADFKNGSVENIPYNSSSFDIVFLGHVLHESDDPVKALTEAHRVARKRVAVLEWPYAEEPMVPPLAHRLSRETVEKSAIAAGFQKVLVIYMKHMVLYRMEK
jgi:ubiquinone/menaquinone biosynthesis C-methylase UbiE